MDCSAVHTECSLLVGTSKYLAYRHFNSEDLRSIQRLSEQFTSFGLTLSMIHMQACEFIMIPRLLGVFVLV